MTPNCWLTVALTLPLVSAPVVAQLSPEVPTYLFCSERVNPLEGRPFTRYKLRTEGVELQFVPPPEWSVKYDPDKRIVTLLTLDLDGGVTLNIDLGEKEGESGVTDGEQLKARILGRYEGARRLRQYRRPIAGIECVGYEFEQPVDKDLLATFRVIEVAFRGGRVEFEMKSSSRKFADFDPLFSALLGSFRIQRVVR